MDRVFGFLDTTEFGNVVNNKSNICYVACELWYNMSSKMWEINRTGNMVFSNKYLELRAKYSKSDDSFLNEHKNITGRKRFTEESRKSWPTVSTTEGTPGYVVRIIDKHERFNPKQQPYIRGDQQSNSEENVHFIAIYETTTETSPINCVYR